VVEKYIPQTRRRRDLFGVIDIVAIKAGQPVLGIQTTSATNQAARFNKAVIQPELRTWLETGSLFHVHGWAKKGKRGKRKTWQVNVREVRLSDLLEVRAEEEE
jgi:hypothetical protein